MLDFRFEWEEAPGVRMELLAATWARIEILCGGEPITRFWSEPANTVRTGVYGSALPIARWVIKNWWALLHERIDAPEVLRGARDSRSDHRRWFERHNLWSNREGMACPDLSIYREDDCVGVRWVAHAGASPLPGRFLADGADRITLPEAEGALARAVESVLERTEGLQSTELEDLRANWCAIRDADPVEATLCARLAALGLDPYAPDPDEALEERLASLALPEAMLRDLLAATSSDRLSLDLFEIERFTRSLPPAVETGAPLAIGLGMEVPSDVLPYRAGYRRARAVRRHLGLAETAPDPDLEPLLAEAIRSEPALEWSDGGASSIDAVVHRDGTCALSAGRRSWPAKRFLLARALHHWLFVAGGTSPRRLLTRANDWQQAASRAFAAELLAPAAALSQRLGRGTGWDRNEDLARAFEVDAMVIAHQLENHGLG